MGSRIQTSNVGNTRGEKRKKSKFVQQMKKLRQVDNVFAPKVREQINGPDPKQSPTCPVPTHTWSVVRSNYF